jgi:7-carboxy-7-deazaguanine synthase
MFLNVSEIFFSIQGESTYAGLPCIFIRLSGCNLRCTYCDTRYSYEGGRKISIEEILDKIKKYPCKNVEVTGGEPLLQKSSLPLMDTLLENGYSVLLETNGSIDISEVNNNVIRIVDIKCPGSAEEKSFNFDNIKRLKNSDEVKFVISSKEDYEYAKKVIGDYGLEKKCNVLMSCAHKTLSLDTLADWILKDGLDVRLQIQLHKHIFGDKRGV